MYFTASLKAASQLVLKPFCSNSISLNIPTKLYKIRRYFRLVLETNFQYYTIKREYGSM